MTVKRSPSCSTTSVKGTNAVPFCTPAFGRLSYCPEQEIKMTTTSEEGGRGNLFLIGLMAGTAIGAGLALAFAPRMASEIRERLTESATEFGQAASRGYQRVSTRVADAVDGVTQRGEAAGHAVADAIGHGAREVEEFAEAAKASPGGWKS
jgi:gas vesicle protein